MKPLMNADMGSVIPAKAGIQVFEPRNLALTQAREANHAMKGTTSSTDFADLRRLTHSESVKSAQSADSLSCVSHDSPFPGFCFTVLSPSLYNEVANPERKGLVRHRRM
jgi:hypothetical protein